MGIACVAGGTSPSPPALEIDFCRDYFSSPDVARDTHVGGRRATVPTGFFRDILIGLGGVDYLNGHAAADLILGNDGSDALDGDYSPDYVHGGAGNDLIWGRNGHDRLWGGPGFDTLYGDERFAEDTNGGDEIISIEDDGVADEIDCGGRWDRVVARPNNAVTDCERVIRIAR
jgi:Ca2+-binding RTX toxin-like protein